MSSMTIRNVDPTTKERLRQRAARHGRSVAEELRALVSAATNESATPTASLADAIRRRFAPLGGVELAPHPPVAPSEPPTFEP